MGSSRRNFVKQSAMLGLLSGTSFTRVNESAKLKIVCTGGHPDDPESGCGGTLAKFAAAGHAVTIIYLTRGEAGIPGKSHADAASIRSREAEKASALLNVKPVFAGQIDGDTVVNTAWITKMKELIAAEKPDVVFTHWPIDSHKDHQAASLLTIQAWVQSKEKFDLYFYEVCNGEQTMTFRPTDYVDISSTQEVKRKALYCHESQDPAGIYGCGHTAMEKFRGMESGYNAAEGFVRMNGANAKSKIL